MAVTTEIDVRYRDLDTNGHVNNAVISTYLEHSRGTYLEEVIGIGLDEYPFVIAHLEIDFERSIQPEETVECTVHVPELGTSSLPMHHEITADGERAVAGESTLVFLDGEGGSPAPLLEEIREPIEAHEGL